MKLELTGLVAAAHTPMHEDFSLNLGQIEPLVAHFLQEGLGGLYVCGSTGEGPLLSSRERKATAEAYVKSAGGKIPVIVQVGHNSLVEAGVSI